MFGPLGAPEIIFILLLALLIFGPRRLPEMGRTIGKAMGEFRRATTDLKRSINTEIALEDADDRPKYQRGPTRKSVESPGAGVDAEGLLEPAPAAGTQPRDGGGGAAEPGAAQPDAANGAAETASGEAGDDGADTAAEPAAAGESGAGSAAAAADGGVEDTAGSEAEADGDARDGDDGEDRVAARG